MSDLGPCARPGCGSPASWLYSGPERDRPEAPVCSACYRAEEFAPGHVRSGSALHFMGLCGDCDARYLSGATLEQAEDWYRQGMIGQDAYEAYCHVWATSAYRYSAYGIWSEPPVIPEVIRLAAIMRAGLEARKS